MIELHHTNYFFVGFDKPNELFHYVFYETTEDMQPEEYIAELKVFIELVKKYKPKKVFGDMMNFRFVITPIIQEWVNENLFSVYREIGFKKIAIKLSKGIFEQVSIEQTMEEDKSEAFTVVYFEDEETAFNWLLHT